MSARGGVGAWFRASVSDDKPSRVLVPRFEGVSKQLGKSGRRLDIDGRKPKASGRRSGSSNRIAKVNPR